MAGEHRSHFKSYCSQGNHRELLFLPALPPTPWQAGFLQLVPSAGGSYMGESGFLTGPRGQQLGLSNTAHSCPQWEGTCVLSPPPLRVNQLFSQALWEWEELPYFCPVHRRVAVPWGFCRASGQLQSLLIILQGLGLLSSPLPSLKQYLGVLALLKAQQKPHHPLHSIRALQCCSSVGAAVGAVPQVQCWGSSGCCPPALRIQVVPGVCRQSPGACWCSGCREERGLPPQRSQHGQEPVL